MHLIGALLLAAVIGGGVFGYLGHVSRQVADHGTPRAQRVAKGGRSAAGKGRKAAQRGVAEIWAEVRAAEWLERRRNRRAARRAVARGTGRGAAATARGLGRAARATGRGGWRGGRALIRRVRGKGQAATTDGAATQSPGAPVTDDRCGWCGAPSGTACLPVCWCAACQTRKGPPPFITQPIPEDTTRPQERGPVPVTTTTTNGASPAPAPGGGADLFTAIQQVIGHAMSGGLRSKQRSFKVLEDSFDYMSQHLTAFSRQLAEPGQEYPASIWEPLAQAAAHLKAAASAAGESSSGLGALAGMNLGEAADSAVHVPHNTQLNASS